MARVKTACRGLSPSRLGQDDVVRVLHLPPAGRPLKGYQCGRLMQLGRCVALACAILGMATFVSLKVLSPSARQNCAS